MSNIEKNQQEHDRHHGPWPELPSGGRILAPVTRRRVATLEREAPRTVELAREAGVTIEYLGISPLFKDTRSYVGEGSDWVLGPAQQSDTAFIPREPARALVRLNEAGVNFPMLFIAHEIEKGKLPQSGHMAVGAMLPVTASEAAQLVGPAPPPLTTVELGDRLAERAHQVFVIMRKVATGMGVAAAAPFVLAGAAIGALATLDPIVLGAIPAISSVEGEPAAWYVLARWDW